jgi:hypothetical protein
MQRDFILPALTPAADEPAEPARLKVRTAWISDLHLGTPGCRADALLDLPPSGIQVTPDIFSSCRILPPGPAKWE